MTRKVAICGNHDFPIDAAIGTQIVDVIRDLPEDALILTRGVSGFELFVAHTCLILGRRCFTYVGKGGGDNLARDLDLVTDCDEMLAFFAPGNLERETGAAKVVERALYLSKPVRAATVVDGSLVWAEQ